MRSDSAIVRDEQGSRGRKPRFLFLLNVAHRRLLAAAQGDAEGKTAARAGLLMALSADGAPMPLGQLGEALDLSASALSGLVDRMSRDGLIVRSPDPNDGRAWNIALTETGKARRAEAVPVARLLNEKLCEGFDDAELAVVARWLDAVCEKFPRETMK
ncbi:MarR family transcriptional regulator [Sphingomonas koreensis]|jgi:DNA-binding MarR family transcriptional regulator|uniref:MarR family transcriptional regulator n=1 Tax=Sphingomonas koreensis TaxID=93064 RepID=A0AAJ4S2S1_9SPHN|nr:MarR family transcriptional regulator [Sphingomonas koreensis]MDC7809672.1 MarR family transcriptional regulator [Sphingomonas koreensis]RSU18626.1 MarR family transcriptional regulator [Sphingomonas koreensis]RSU18865.1 MarR family transcriptional regulator [Sphingomonas koreensis]RSU24816.1 MarR family transcriptional regulator [Sphingomonas koreensis]RSU34547.1 MarR family transcriptional regulator [Sphingomonas koreensis]